MENKNIKREVWSKFLRENKEVIDKIQKRAADIHASVNQTYDEMPYSFHTNMVSNIFMQFGHPCFMNSIFVTDDGLAVVFASAFHDTIEDCRLRYNDVVKIAKEYMNERQAILAADIVYALTNEKGKTRAERANEKYYEGIRETPYAPCVKLCDRYANALYANARRSSMSGKYSKKMVEFISHIAVDTYDVKYSLPEELVSLCMSYPLYREESNKEE